MATVVNPITTYRTIPSGLIALVKQVTEAKLAKISIEDGQLYKGRHYAGEWLAEDNLNKLVGDVSQFSTVMWDIEAIEEDDEDDSQRMPDDIFRFILFCCVSNRFDASIQWYSSYDLAWDIRAAFQGVQFTSAPDITSNGFFKPQTIERELHVPGLSVHTLRINAGLVTDVDGVLSQVGGGYNFSLVEDSHYIPLT